MVALETLIRHRWSPLRLVHVWSPEGMLLGVRALSGVPAAKPRPSFLSPSSLSLLSLFSLSLVITTGSVVSWIEVDVCRVRNRVTLVGLLVWHRVSLKARSCLGRSRQQLFVGTDAPVSVN